MGVEVHQDYLLVVHGQNAPDAADWDRYLDALQGWRLTGRGQLVYTLGGMPDSVQRASSISLGKDMARERKARGGAMPPTAVMTNSTAARALATLFNWFFDDSFRAFSLDDWAGSLAHLRTDTALQGALRDRVTRMLKLVS